MPEIITSTIDITHPYLAGCNKPDAVEPATQLKADSSCFAQLQAEHERIKQREKLFIEQSSWLQGNNTHALGKIESLGSPEQDEKMLALLAGDGFIGNTKWEGANSLDTLTYFDGLLDRFIANPLFADAEKSSLAKLKDRFAHSKRVTEKISELKKLKKNGATLEQTKQNLKACATELAEQYKQQVQKEGQAWLPLGWSSRSGSSHFLWCHFTKDSFSIINTGAGLDYHPQVSRTVKKQARDGDVVDAVEEELRYQQHVTYEGIDKEKLFDPFFWQALLESDLLALWEPDRFYSSSFLYESVVGFLGGKKKRALDPKRYPDFYQKDQRSGSCAMRGLTHSVFAELTGVLEKKPNQAKAKKNKILYKQMKWLWQSEALVRVAQQSLPKEEDTLSSYNMSQCPLERAQLIRDVVENLRDAQKKLAQSGQPVPIAIVNGGSATLLEIELRLKRWQELLDESRSSFKNGAIDFQTAPVVEKKAEKIAADTAKALKEQQPIVKQNNGTAKLFLPYKESFYGLLKDAHELSGRSITTKAELLSSLKDQANALLRLKKADLDCQDKLFKPINEMLISLPLPNEPKGAALWAALDLKEREEAIELLYQLLCHFSSLKNQELLGTDSSSLVASYSLLVCIDHLARLDPAAKMADASKMRYHRLLDDISNLSLESYQEHQRLSSILHYFSPKEVVQNASLDSDQWQVPFQRLLLDQKKNEKKDEKLKAEADALFSFINSPGLFFNSRSPLMLDKNQIEKSTTLRYFAQFLQEEQIVSELRKRLLARPDRKADDPVSIQELLVTLMSEPMDGHSLLPKSVHIAMRASLICHNFPLKHKAFNTLHSDPQTPLIQWKKSSNDKWFFDGIALEADRISPRYFACRAGSGASFKWQDSQNEVMVQKDAVVLGEVKLDQELSREFRMIGVDPYQEAHRALSFFGEQLDLLEEKGSCELLFYHLKSAGRLPSTAYDGGQFQQEAKLFFDKAMRYHGEHGNWHTWLELARLADWLFGYLKESGRLSADEPFSQMRALIEEQGKQLAEREPLKWSQQWLPVFSAAKLALYKNSFFQHPSSEEKKAFLKDFFGWRLSARRALNTKTATLQAAIEADKQNRIYATQWLKELDDEEKNGLFCELAALFQFEGRKKGWAFDQLSLRALNNEGSQLELSLEEGKVMSAGDDASLSALPLSLLNDDLFQKLIASTGQTGPVIEKDKGVFCLPDHELKIWQINDPPSYCFQKQFDGRLYQISSLSSSLTSLFEPLKDEKARYWLHFEEKKDERQTMHLLVEKEGSKLWEALIICDEQGAYHIEQLMKDDKQLIRFEQFTPSLQQALLQNKLEADTHNIYGWASPGSRQVEKICLPRCSGLSFTVKQDPADGQYKAYSDKLTGFYLDPDQGLAALPSDKKRFVFKDNTGCRFAFLEYNPSALDIALKAKSRLDLYKVIGNELKPLDFEAAIHLAQFYLEKEHDYDKASALLSSHAKLLRAYTPSEEQLLKVFLTSCLQKLGHPKSYSIALKLLIEIERNHLKYGRRGAKGGIDSMGLDLDNLKAIYRCYCKCQGDLLQDKLSADEELFWLEMVGQRCQSSKMVNFSTAAWLDLLGFGKRYLYLKKGRVSFKDSKVVNLKAPAEEKQKQTISIKDLTDSFDLHIKKEAQTPKEELFFTATKKHSQEFSDRFWDYYAIATEGSHQERKRLLSSLLLNRHLLNDPQGKEVDRLYWHLLVFVLNRPKKALSKLPKISELEKLSKEDKKKFNKKISILCKESKRFSLVGFGLIVQLFSAFKELFFSNIKYSLLSFFVKDKKKPEPRSNAKPTFVWWNQPSLDSLDGAFKSRLTALASSYFDRQTRPCTVSEEPLPPIAEEEQIEPRVRQKVNQVGEQLNAWRLQKKQQTDDLYTLKADKSVQQLKQELLKEAAYWQSQLKTEVITLAAIAQGERATASEGLIKKGGGRRRPFAWADLEQLFVTRDKALASSKSYLALEAFNKLQEGYAEFLVKAVRLQQMQQALGCIEELLQHPKGTQERAFFEQRLAELLTADRHYDLKEQMRSRLQFEAKSGFFYRKNQIAKLDQVAQSKAVKTSLEAPTGFGKTALVTPTLDEELADQKLVINVLPAFIEETNLRELAERYQSCYGRGVDRIAFDRNSAITAAGLELIYAEMIEDLRAGKPMNIRADSLRSMELHLLILLHKVEQGGMKTEQRRSITALVKILRLIRCSSVAIIDEERAAMNPLDKLVYALGESSSLPFEHVELIDTLFSLLPEKAGLGKKERPHFTEELFREQVARPLAEAMSQRLGVASHLHEEYMAFILDAKLAPPVWLKAHPKREQICLLRGMTAKILPQSLNGSVDLNYGLSKLHFRSSQGNKEFAIPYRSANTPKENEKLPSVYKCPRSTLVKTYITYYEKGLTDEQALDALKALQIDAKAEIAKKNIDAAKTSAGAIFAAMAPEGSLPLLSLTEGQLKQIAGNALHSKPLIHYYLKNVIAPQIEVYETSLVSTVQNMRSQFQKSIGLSATPPSPASTGLGTLLISMEGTSESALDLMLAKCADQETLHTVDGDPLQAAIEKASQKGPLRVIVDVGAFGRGKSSAEVAALLGDKFKGRKEIGQVVYFDENKELFCLLDLATGEILELDEKAQELQNRFTYFDQARSCGSNLKQLLNAAALISVGIKTTRAELQQGAGRMRDLHGQQGIEVVLQSEAAEQFFGQRQIPSMGALLQKLLINEVKEEMHDHYLSQLQQVDNSLRNGAINHLLGLEAVQRDRKRPLDLESKVNIAAMIRRWSSYKELFLQKQSQSCWQLYGQAQREADAVETLKGYKKRAEASKCLRKMPYGRSRAVKRELAAIEREWGPSMLLPAKVVEGEVDLNEEMEFFADLELNAENEQEQKIEVAQTVRKKAYWPETLDLFENDRWQKPVNMRSVAFRVRKAAVSSIIKLGDSPIKIGLGLYAASLVCSISGAVFCFLLPPVGIVLSIASLALLVSAGAVFFLYGSPILLKNKSRQGCFYRSVELIDDLPKELKPLSKSLSKKLLVSENFCQQKQKINFNGQPAQKLFSCEHKPLFQLLVTQKQTKKGAEIEVAAIDQNDSVYFHRKLKEDRLLTSEEKASKRTKKIAIVDVDTSQLGRVAILAQGKNGFAEGELEGNALFKKLLVEAKVMRGKTVLSDEELSIVDQKVKKAGVGKALKTLYNDYLLRRSPIRRKLFQGSALAARMA